MPTTKGKEKQKSAAPRSHRYKSRPILEDSDDEQAPTDFVVIPGIPLNDGYSTESSINNIADLPVTSDYTSCGESDFSMISDGENLPNAGDVDMGEYAYTYSGILTLKFSYSRRSATSSFSSC